MLWLCPKEIAFRHFHVSGQRQCLGLSFWGIQKSHRITLFTTFLHWTVMGMCSFRNNIKPLFFSSFCLLEAYLVKVYQKRSSLMFLVIICMLFLPFPIDRSSPKGKSNSVFCYFFVAILRFPYNSAARQI